MAAFRVGERVRLAAGRSCAQHGPGTEGIVTYAPDHAHWVGIRFDGSDREFTPNPDRLVRVIDWTLPIELSDGTPLIATDNGEEHHVSIRLAWASYVHSAFPIDRSKGSARREGGLVCSNHKFYVRNRIMTQTQTFKTGDRVRYRRERPGLGIMPWASSWAGREGVVVHDSTSDSTKVRWNDDGGTDLPYTCNLELIAARGGIDVTKGLLLNNNAKLEVTFVTETSDGHILVDVQSNGWVVFDKNGAYVRSKASFPYKPTLVNKKTQTIDYIPVTPSGTPVIGDYKNAQLGWDQNPECQFMVRIHKVDGVVTNIDAVKRS